MPIANNYKVIQGGGDGTVIKKFSQDDISETIDFCFQALNAVENVPKEAEGATNGTANGATNGAANENMERLAPDDERVIKGIRIFTKATAMADMDEFANSNIDGWAPRLELGNLGLQATG